MTTSALLQIDNLNITLPTAYGNLPAVRGMSLSLQRGEALGIVGESGSGKSMTALALMRLLPAGAMLRADRMRCDSQDLLQMSDEGFAQSVAGRKIAMIFQEPMTSLNPVYTIERQMTELLVHDGTSPKQARERALYLLDRVKLPDPQQRLASYPHQLSGGQRQRVMIAMALMTDPRVLIADEPTTALDVTVQAQILELLSELRQEFGMAMILITHDLAVVANTVDRVMVMYAGEPLEVGSTQAVLSRPQHPYTQSLLRCAPGVSGKGHRLGAIPGIVPSLLESWQGCIFSSRCALVKADCKTAPIARSDRDGAGGWFRCIHPAPFEPIKAQSSATSVQDEPQAKAPILQARNVFRAFTSRRGIFGKPYTLQALKGVSADVAEGETLAIVGESGCGKSTFAKILLGLDAPDSGSVTFGGKDVASLDALERARWVQPIFQDPYSSLNPRHSIGEIVARPLVVHGVGTAAEQRDKAAEMLVRVGLPARVLNSYPNQMSGGQRQRVAIARALVLRPRVLLCDEPTSALDVSVQAQILNLLQDLQTEFGLSMVFITHDIGVVRQIADRVIVMQKGEVVESGAAYRVLAQPRHDYTAVLLGSVPSLDCLTH